MGLMLKAHPEGAGRRRRPHLQMGAEEALSRRCCSRSARTARRCAFIMPERIAKTDPFKQITEYIGSGPMKFAKRRMGARRQGGVREVRRLRAAAGEGVLARRRQEDAGRPHRMGGHARIPRRPRPRCRTARSTGGRTRSPISCRCSRRTSNISVDIADPLGNIGSFRMNHLHPPFNDVKVRRAVLMALSQEDYMRALVGDDDSAVEAAARASSRRIRRSTPKRAARS